MSAVVLRFACGHEVLLNGPVADWPVCPCGEPRIRQVTSPPPTIRAVGVDVAGPLVIIEEDE